MESRKTRTKPKTSHVEQMFNTHDPLEEHYRSERPEEDNYFRKFDQELMVALRERDAEEIEHAIRTYTRMRCPKCGEPLASTLDGGTTLDTCPGCGGIWLDKGNWEGQVGPKDPSWLQRLFAGLIASKPSTRVSMSLGTLASRCKTSPRRTSRRKPLYTEHMFDEGEV